jgi:hypothetical protein
MKKTTCKMSFFASALMVFAGSLLAFSNPADQARIERALEPSRSNASPTPTPCDPNMAKPQKDPASSTNGPLVSPAVAAGISRPARDLPAAPVNTGPPREINPRNSIDRDKIKPCTNAGQSSPGSRSKKKPRSRHRKPTE